MIITCPNCQTRYQVANESIGSAGRKVQCAHCQSAWQALPTPPSRPRPQLVTNRPAPESDRLFDAEDENGLDAVFAREEQKVFAEQRAEIVAETVAGAIEGKKNKEAANADPGLSRKQQKAMSRRRDDLISSLPYAKVRRTARMIGMVALVSLVAGAIQFRTDIVRQFPDLAGIYRTIGLPVNVIGLEFRDLRTLRTLRDGQELMMIDAKIASVSQTITKVPPIVVTLLDANGESRYEWSVVPEAHDLVPGEIMNFATQLASPPLDSARVKLTFINGRTSGEKANVGTNRSSTVKEESALSEQAPPEQSSAEQADTAPSGGAHH